MRSQFHETIFHLSHLDNCHWESSFIVLSVTMKGWSCANGAWQDMGWIIGVQWHSHQKLLLCKWFFPSQLNNEGFYQQTGSVPTTQSPKRNVGTITLWPMARECASMTFASGATCQHQHTPISFINTWFGTHVTTLQPQGGNECGWYLLSKTVDDYAIILTST